MTTVLGLTPARTCRANEPPTNPKGHPLGGVSRETYWYTVLLKDGRSETRLPAALDRLLDQLERHKNFLHQLSFGGGSAEFFIGWFFDGGNCGDAFGPELLARLADFKMILSLDAYAPSDDGPRLVTRDG